MSKLREAWTSLRAFLVLGVGLIAGVHYYLWARLIRDVGLPAATARALTWILCGLAVSIPVAVFTSRLTPRAWSVWWVTPVYLWIGTSFLLLLSVAGVDMLRVAGAPELTARAGALVALALGLCASAWAAREGRTVRVKRVEVPISADCHPRSWPWARSISSWRRTSTMRCACRARVCRSICTCTRVESTASTSSRGAPRSGSLRSFAPESRACFDDG